MIMKHLYWIYFFVLNLWLTNFSVLKFLLILECTVINTFAMRTFGFNMLFKFDLKEPEPSFNFTKADCVSFGKTLETMISELGDVETE